MPDEIKRKDGTAHPRPAAIADGGPAFPTLDFVRRGDEAVGKSKPGLSLRDYFAAEALPAVVAGWIAHGELLGEFDGDDLSAVADMAYNLADAMLAARARRAAAA